MTRPCATCHALLIRRRNEGRKMFENRKHCSRKCGVEAQMKGRVKWWK